MIAVAECANDTHLAALGRINLQYLMKDGFADKLRQVTSADQVIELLTKLQKVEEPVWAPANDSGDFIVAVTACTTVLPTLTWLKKPFKKWLLNWVLVSLS